MGSRARAKKLAASIAGSLDAPLSLLPHLPKLLQSCDSLGSTPRRVAALLASHGVDRSSRVVDLACGKGSVAIELAARVGCRVLGMDAFEPFVETAREKAVRAAVGGLCEFVIGDVDRAAGRVRRADAALMLGLYPYDRAARLLRRCVRAGGVYLVDDAVDLSQEASVREAKRTAERFFESLGDRVLLAEAMTPSAIDRMNRSLYRRISAQAREVVRSDPRSRAAVREFLQRQRDANRLLRTTIRPVLWLVRRGNA